MLFSHRLIFMLKGKYYLLFHLVCDTSWKPPFSADGRDIFYLIDILKTSSIFSMWIRKYARVRYEMGAIWLKVFKSNFISLDSPVLLYSSLTLIRMNKFANEWWINFKFQCKYVLTCTKTPWTSLCWLILCFKVVSTRLLPETIQLHIVASFAPCSLNAIKSFVTESIF